MAPGEMRIGLRAIIKHLRSGRSVGRINCQHLCDQLPQWFGETIGYRGVLGLTDAFAEHIIIQIRLIKW